MPTKPKLKPVHKHDCDKCVFLGTIRSIDRPGEVADLYIHERMYHNGHASIIARYSSSGPDYASWPTMHSPSLLSDLRIAEQLASKSVFFITARK